MGKYTRTSETHAFPNRSIPAAAALKAQERHTVDPNGCWISDFSPNKVNGYASVTWQDDGRAYGTTAHRASFTHTNGPIADGMVIDHTCHNRRCVNPAHLRALTRDENARRQVAGDFPLGQCRYGHPLSASRKRVKGVSAGLTYCGDCLKDQNARLASYRSALYNLELAYGLGGHEGKKNYNYRMGLRQARVDAVRNGRISESVRPNDE